MNAVALRLYQYLSVGLFKTCLSIHNVRVYLCTRYLSAFRCTEYSDLGLTRSNINELETGSRIDEVDFCDNIIKDQVLLHHSDSLLWSTHCSETGKVRHVDHHAVTYVD